MPAVLGAGREGGKIKVAAVCQSSVGTAGMVETDSSTTA